MAIDILREPIYPGERKDIQLQCRTLAATCARYAAGDTLSAAVYQWGIDATGVANATCAWDTAKDPATGTPRQTGYEEGQVILSIPSAESAKLVPGVRYVAIATRTMAADGTQSEKIAVVELVVRRVSATY
jgi:hypothetical protein